MHLPLTIRASEADRVFSCPGSLLLAPRVRVPRRADGEEGEALHYLIARLAIDELGAEAPEGGLTRPGNPHVPAHLEWIPEWAIRHVRERIPPSWSLLVEVPLAYRYYLPVPVEVPVEEILGPIPNDHRVVDGKVIIEYVVISGHIDILGLSPDGKQCIGIDWKTGIVGADEAETNWQAASYLGLCKHAWPELEKGLFELAQPRIDEEATGIKRISSTALEGDELSRLHSVLSDHVFRSLIQRYTTDSGAKQCRWCPVAMARPWQCPSLQIELSTMKAQITAGILESLKAKPNDGELGDFVISGRTLGEPVKEATELLHARLDEVGYVDAACGVRITRSTQKGSIEIPDPLAYWKILRRILPNEERMARVVTPSKTRLIDELAADREIPKTSKSGASATAIYEEHLAPLTKQNERRVLVIK